jgi:hypothetical protein
MLYEKEIQDNETKKFFKRLTKLQPYYNNKRFEKSYQKQAFNQKFMREVSYKVCVLLYCAAPYVVSLCNHFVVALRSLCSRFVVAL